MTILGVDQEVGVGDGGGVLRKNVIARAIFFKRNFTFYYVNLISLNFPGGPDPLDPHMTQHTNKSA